MLPLFERIKNGADEILQMNQRNMSDANDQARRSAAAARKQMFVLLLAGMVLASAFLLLTGRWILRPIQRLIGSAEEIRRGNLDLVVATGSRDEIGRLSEAFNAMAASLREFRRTDQARLLRIQKATQEAFDSLPDAVAVVRSRGEGRGRHGVGPDRLRAETGRGRARLAVRLDGRPFPPGAPERPRRRVGRRPGHPAIRPGRGEILSSRSGPHPGRRAADDGVILVLKDVTQLRQQDEIKKSVIRTVSHQLNTPLTSVRMAIHLLLEEKVGALTEKQTELLLTAREDSERLHGILDGLLDISRLESGKVQMDYRALPPSSIVTQALEPFRRAAQDRGISLREDIEDGLPDVWVDPTRIGHVFGNLLSNALKHTPPGGRITVTAEPGEAWVRFRVSDTGEGIPAPFLSRIFEPFFRVPGRKNETGAGLGLAIVKEIVEAHGGSVGVESREGEGSSFSFTLRRADRFPKEEVLT